MPPWTKMRCCKSYKIHGLQSSNFAFKLLLWQQIFRFFTSTLSIFLRSFLSNNSTIKLSNSISRYQATKRMTDERYLLKVWISFYNSYHLKDVHTCLISSCDNFQQITTNSRHQILCTRAAKMVRTGKYLLHTSSANLFPVTSTPWNVNLE